MIYRLLDALPMPSWPFIGFLIAFAIAATLCIEAGRRMYLRHRIAELARRNAELKTEIHEAQALIAAYVVRDEKWTAQVAVLTEELSAAAQECVELKAALSLSEKLVDEQALKLQSAVGRDAPSDEGIAPSPGKRPAGRKGSEHGH